MLQTNSHDKSYNELVEKLLKEGEIRPDRTGTGILGMFGHFMDFDVSESIPLLTTKKINFANILTETIWMFVQGSTNIKYLKDNGVNIWDSWATSTGELGPIYGQQARDFQGYRVVDGELEIPNVDQISKVIENIRTNPHSRRHLVVLWNPATVPEDSNDFEALVEDGYSALPVCFPKNSYVSVHNGVKDISDIRINDLVLTENGSYKKVIDNSKTLKKDLRCLDIFSVPKIYTTDEHPFYTDTGWKSAEDLTTQDYVKLQKLDRIEHIPEFTFQEKLNQYSIKDVTIKLDNKNLLFFLGYYLGNGFISGPANPTRFELSVPSSKLERLSVIFETVSHFNWSQGCSDKVYKGESSNSVLIQLLKLFGHKAFNKTIPDFILNLPLDLLNSFLKGYEEADGYLRNNTSRITTVSNNIAYSYQKAMMNTGKLSNILFQKRPSKTFIEGSEVSQKDTYSLEYNSNTPKSFYKIIDNEFYVKVRSNSKSNPKNYDGYVYNLTVEDNHTYTVNNVLVHNCHGVVIQFYVNEGNRLSLQVYVR